MVPLSVVIPVYNAEKYIIQAVQSIGKQTLKPSEVILVDDASSDNSMRYARREAYKWGLPIKIVSHTQNCGIGRTRQDGAVASRGKYIAFLSADDYWSPLFLERAMPLLGENRAVFSDYYQCDQYLKPFSVYHAPNGNLRNLIIQFALQKNMFINFSSVVYPKTIFEACTFESDLRHGEDLIFLLDTIIAGLNYAHIREPHLFYRIHQKQGTNVHAIGEWKQLWFHIEQRLTTLGIPKTAIKIAMEKNYKLLYPQPTFKWATKRNIAKLLSKNRYGFKTKSVLKNIPIKRRFL